MARKISEASILEREQNSLRWQGVIDDGRFSNITDFAKHAGITNSKRIKALHSYMRQAVMLPRGEIDAINYFIDHNQPMHKSPVIITQERIARITNELKNAIAVRDGVSLDDISIAYTVKR